MSSSAFLLQISNQSVASLPPGSGHVDPNLLQQTLPVADVKIGPPSPDLSLDV